MKNPTSSPIRILRDGLEVASTNTRKMHIRIDAGLQKNGDDGDDEDDDDYLRIDLDVPS